MLRLCRRKEAIVTKTRRSSLEVIEAQMAKLEDLEARKAKLETKLKKNTNKPIHWAIVRAIALLAINIHTLVRAIRNSGKKRKK